MKVLVADDSRVSNTMLTRELTSLGHEVITTSDGVAALELLRASDGPDLALLDWMMPGMEGIDVCQRIRDEITDRYVYVVLVTMKDRPEDIAEGFAAGADDFIVKPFAPAELAARVRVAERVLRYTERLRQANEDLIRLSAIDELTHLYTRSALLDRLMTEASRHTREGTPISVLIADIDGLSAINETHGPAAGDAVVRAIADLTQGACRLYDTVGRYGGDSFLVLLPGADSDNAMTIAERLRDHVEATTVRHPTHVADSAEGIVREKLTATVSIGTGTWMPGNKIAPQHVVQAAERALARASERGTNTIETAEPGDYDAAVEPVTHKRR